MVRWRGVLVGFVGLLGVVFVFVGLFVPRWWWEGGWSRPGEGSGLDVEGVLVAPRVPVGELEGAGLPNPVEEYGMGVLGEGLRNPGEAETLYAPHPIKEFHVQCDGPGRAEMGVQEGTGWALPSVNVQSSPLVRRSVSPGGSAPVPSAPQGMLWDNGVKVGASEGVLMGLGHVNYDAPYHLSLSSFGALHRVQECASVYVWEDGVVQEYLVEELFTVGQGEFSSRSDLFETGGEHRLVWVTCSGRQVGDVFGSVLGGYTDNLVMVARPVR